MVEESILMSSNEQYVGCFTEFFKWQLVIAIFLDKDNRDWSTGRYFGHFIAVLVSTWQFSEENISDGW